MWKWELTKASADDAEALGVWCKCAYLKRKLTRPQPSAKGMVTILNAQVETSGSFRTALQHLQLRSSLGFKANSGPGAWRRWGAITPRASHCALSGWLLCWCSPSLSPSLSLSRSGTSSAGFPGSTFPVLLEGSLWSLDTQALGHGGS